MDEFNEDLQTSVTIKRPLWKVIVGFVAVLAIAVVAVWAREILITILAIPALALAIGRAKTPEFAVEKKGIRFPVARRPGKSTGFWGLGDLGLYLWDEVSYGHWSHHQPGELNVQVKRTRSMDKGVEDARTRIFYRVPELYQAEVEKALRARRKWLE
jgi:hypothetical protein